MAGLVALPEVKWEIGLTGPTTDPDWWHIGDATRGLIGTAAIGPDDVWSDVTQWVRSWSMRRGASRDNGPGPIVYEGGTCTLELNNGDRRFDPTNLSGPYVSGGESQLQPMVRVRGTAYRDGVPYRLITALADSWTPQYPGPTWSTVTLTASDAFKVFASQDRSPSGAVGASEDSGARVTRVLNNLGWPTDDRAVDTGDSTLQATTLDGNGLAELQLVADSEYGEFYIDPEGTAVFRRRLALAADTRSNTSQVTFGDGGGSEIPYRTVNVDADDTTMANYVSIARAGGAEQTASDAASISRYLRKVHQRTDLLMETDAVALDYAKFVLARSKDPEVRFGQIQMGVPRSSVAALAWPAMLGLELGDRVTVIRRPPGGGTNSRDCYIRGVEHSSDGGDWSTTLTLETADRTDYWVIGNATLGRIGSAVLAF